MTDRIPMDKCEKGGVYRIRSRNLLFAAYDGNGGFIGIREKFRNLSLFREYYHEQGTSHGTVTPIEKVGQVPEGVELQEYVGEEQKPCPCGHEKATHSRDTSKARGHLCLVGCSECACLAYDGVFCFANYKPLFELLDTYEKTFPRECLLCLAMIPAGGDISAHKPDCPRVRAMEETR